MRQMARALFTLILVTIVCSCHQSVAPLAPLQQTSSEEMESFAQSVCESVTAQDREACLRAYDLEAFVRRCWPEEGLSRQAVSGFIQGAEEQTLGPFTPLSGSTLSYVKTHQVNGEDRVLLRAIGPQGGFQFLDLIVEKRENQLRVVDSYTYGQGELLSKITQALTIRKLRDDELQLLADFVAACRTRQSAKAREFYGRLSPKLALSKFVLCNYMAVAYESDSELFLKLVEDYQKNYPEDSELYFVLFDRYLLEGDLEKTIDCLHTIQISLSIEDAYLLCFEANCYLTLQQPGKALPLIARAEAIEPELEEIRWSYLDYYSVQNDFRGLAVELDRLLPNNPHLVNSVATSPEMETFRASPEGSTWLENAR